MISVLAFFIVLLLVAPSQAQDCNICGDGNSIQFPQGVVEFTYQGTKLKNSCVNWQETVKNVNAISDEFCRNEMLQYTKDRCRCTTPEGDLLSDLAPPTIAPTPSSVFIKDPKPNSATTIDGGNKTDVSKCEQTSGSADDCDDSEVKDTSSANTRTFIECIGVFAFVSSLLMI
jgi:hypothetical protein